IAYLECFSGISGDMFLGALVDGGVPPQILQDTVAALNIGARLDISRVVRCGISATKVDVWVDGEKDLPREEYWARQKKGIPQSVALDHNHTHDGETDHHHENEHPSASNHTHATTPEHGHSHSHTRGLSDICTIIGNAKISESAKKTALSIFKALG